MDCRAGCKATTWQGMETKKTSIATRRDVRRAMTRRGRLSERGRRIRYHDPRVRKQSSHMPKPRRREQMGHDYHRADGCQGEVDDSMLQKVNELLKERLEANSIRLTRRSLARSASSSSA